ncbi:fibronectin type III domain-containing protein, partial [Patescibacteria group bacterium]|nr:fibronectin type III domain-containing protein [Patescibacteria group bacterium]
TGEKTISTTSSTVIDTTTQTGNTLVTHLYCGDSEDACNPQGDTLEYQDVWVEISYIINPPTVTTSAATGVTSSQATLNGNITDTGGVTVDERGFEWDIDSGEPYANSWTEIGSFGTGAFNHTITGLSINTTYYFRAKVRNSVGWGYGSEGSFTTTLLSGGFAGSTGTFTLTTLGTNYVRYYSVDLAGNEEAIGSQQVNIAANTPPEARNLFADTDNPVFCCGVTGYPPVRLGWEFFDPDGDNQSAYQIQVDDDPNFLSPEVDSGQVSSPSTEYAPTTLSFATTYYWQVEVWDDKTTPVSSGWVNGPSFTTISHPFPLVDFDWSPQYPTREEVVQFCSVYEEVTIPCGEPPCPIEVICPADVSTCYSGIGNTNPISCSGGTFLWEIIPPEGGTFVSPTTSVSLNPRIKFLSSDVRLSVTDADNYGPCSITQPITIALPLPEWKEIAPF